MTANALTLGVNVVGYLREAKGIGEAARLYAAALRAAGVAVRTGALDAGSTPSAGEDHASVGALERSRAYPVDLVCLNAPELARMVAEGGRLPGGGYRIGVWAWEVDLVPEEWVATSRRLDEVWVYSRYVAEILGRALPLPVVTVPLAVSAPEPASGAPDAEAALPDGRSPDFTFFQMLDFHSMVRRKNPLGLIEAFRRAFTPGDGARLVVKTFNGEHRPADLAQVEEAAAGRPDVELIDRYVSTSEKDSMLAGCDVYASLHRAEGFGLGLAEAMAHGKPVLATGFSGNLDFMPPGVGYLVDWTSVEVGEGDEVYPPGARWAEPDLDDAARLMRHAFEDRDDARRRGERGRAHVRSGFSPAAAGAIARRRLELVLAERAAEGRLRRFARWRGRG